MFLKADDEGKAEFTEFEYSREPLMMKSKLLKML